MVILDQKGQLEAIEFTLAHYGTRTQGEEFRQTQVASHILEMITTIMDVYNATNELGTNLTVHFTVK